ncbi:MAG TPA: hypothetical protein VK902_07435 [Rubrobacter sp.]|nr:hypothetical protein [Rubrobacter sp.]
MTPASLYRLSGLALVLASALFAVAEVISFSLFTVQGGEEYDLTEIAQTGTFMLQSFLTLLAGTLLLGGLMGLYLRQSEAAGRLGLAGFVPAFFGTSLVVGDFYTNTFVTPMVAREAPAFLDNPLSGILQVWLPFNFSLLALSWLLLAVATLRARVYPRGTSWLLLAATLLALVPIPLSNLPFHAAVALVGLRLLRSREAPARGRRRSKQHR